MGGLRDGKSPAAFAAYGRQGPRTVSEPKIRKPPTCRSHGAQMRFKPLCAACSMQDYGFDRCDGHRSAGFSAATQRSRISWERPDFGAGAVGPELGKAVPHYAFETAHPIVRIPPRDGL